MKKKSLQGAKYKWEPQPKEEGLSMPGSSLCRGSKTPCEEGTVLGLSDNGECIGVMYNHCSFVTEYTLEQFARRFPGEQRIV